MSNEAAHHHKQAAEHRARCAPRPRSRKAHEGGNHEKAAHHAHLAQGHHVNAAEHAENAAKEHVGIRIVDSTPTMSDTSNLLMYSANSVLCIYRRTTSPGSWPAA